MFFGIIKFILTGIKDIDIVIDVSLIINSVWYNNVVYIEFRLNNYLNEGAFMIGLTPAAMTAFSV